MILTSGGEENELIKSEAFSTCFNDSGSCGLSEFKSGNCQLRNFKKSSVVGHGSNHNSDSVTI